MDEDKNPMPAAAIAFGIVLDLLGIGFFVGTGAESLTALIPSVLGTLLVVFGVVGLVRPALRKHMMHAAAAVALLGMLGSARGLAGLPALVSGQEVARSAAVAAQSATAFLCAVFLGLCIASFIRARAARAVAKENETGRA
jgi:hypothetical protein